MVLVLGEEHATTKNKKGTMREETATPAWPWSGGMRREQKKKRTKKRTKKKNKKEEEKKRKKNEQKRKKGESVTSIYSTAVE